MRAVRAEARGGANLLLRPVGVLLLGGIRAYQVLIGPALPRACRFEPSCSRYAYTAIDRYGPLRGSWLALRRLARCQPWGGSGYDPVP